MYVVLAIILFISLFLVVSTLISAILFSAFFNKNKDLIFKLLAAWFVPYVIFIIFFTGPTKTDLYPTKTGTPYLLPWEAGQKHFVIQGNRSFTSHRHDHLYAWDFLMPNGSLILASRSGVVLEVVDRFDSIGLNSNYISIEHENNSVSVYAHIKKNSALAQVGQKIQQGTPIALSGMVGQTFFPHLHFYVKNKITQEPVPIVFQEVADDGIPRAGSFQISNNKILITTEK